MLFIVFLMVVSCKNSTVEKPDNLIPEDRMKDILLDIALLNAARTVDAETLRKNNIRSEAYIYRKYDIDSTQFARSNLYYASRPNRYNAMYKEVEERLKQMEEDEREAGAEQEEENKQPEE